MFGVHRGLGLDLLVNGRCFSHRLSAIEIKHKATSSNVSQHVSDYFVCTRRVVDRAELASWQRIKKKKGNK